MQTLVNGSKQYQNVCDLDRKFWFVTRGGEVALPRAQDELVEVIEAILREKRICFRYQHFDTRQETIEAEPVTLAVHEHQFYVICRQATGPRVYPYRFARMSSVKLRGSFAYPSAGEYDPQVVLRPAFGIFIAQSSRIEDVVIRLGPRWRRYVETHRWHESQSHDQKADGTVEVKLHVRICPELRSWILGFGEDAEVLAPASLREETAARLRAAAAQYPQVDGPSIAPAHQKAKPRQRPARARPRSGSSAQRQRRA